MTEEISKLDETEVGEESIDSSGPRRWTSFLPWLILAVLAVVAIGYALSLSVRGASLLSTPARIAFMSDRDGNWEIYVARLDSDIAGRVMSRRSSRKFSLVLRPVLNGLMPNQPTSIFFIDAHSPLESLTTLVLAV